MIEFTVAMAHCGTCNSNFPLTSKHYCCAQGVGGVEVTMTTSTGATTGGSDLVALRAENERLRGALRGLMMMIENGYLVRQTNGDGDPGWALRQLPLVKALAEAEAALSGEAP